MDEVFRPSSARHKFGKKKRGTSASSRFCLSLNQNKHTQRKLFIFFCVCFVFLFVFVYLFRFDDRLDTGILSLGGDVSRADATGLEP